MMTAMKKILLLAAAAIMAAGAMQAKDSDQVRIYINPGHGSWGPNDRPMATIPYPMLANGMPDTCGFYESNTNLWKCLKMGATLQKMGVKAENIMYSRVQNGPYPYVKDDPNGELYNRPLSEICEEVDANNMDMFISVHSNAAAEGSMTNYPLIIYRGHDGEGGDLAPNSRAMCSATWGPHWMDEVDPQSYYGPNNPNIRGDISFYGSSAVRHGTHGDYEGYLGVLKHGVPGFLIEGYFHTYQPARHRALNADYCGQEGVRIARGVANYWNLNPETTGYIMGTVKDLHEKIVNSLFHYAPKTNDQWLPINGAMVTLKKDGEAVGNYTVDNKYNGIFVFEGLAPGEYTVEATASGYKAQGTYTKATTPTEYQDLVTASLGTIHVEANKTAYIKVYLESETYEPPEITYYNYPDPIQPGYVNLGSSYNFGQDNGTVYELAGTVKKAIVRGDTTVVLTNDGATPHLYAINNATKALIKEMSMEGVVPVDAENAGDFSALNDIAFAADGQLIGVNSQRCQYNNNYVDEGYKRGKINVYKWQDIDAAPVLWVSTMSSNNFFRCNMGKAVAVSGAANGECNVMIAGTNAGGNYKGMRFLNLAIADNTIVSSVYSEKTINGSSNYTELKIGDNYKLVVSPQADNQWVIDGSLTAPIEFAPTGQQNTDSPIVGRFPVASGDSATYVPASNGAFFKYAHHILYVTPYMTGTNVAGVKLFDITNGLANATLIATQGTDLDTAPNGTPAKAVAKAPAYMAAGANVSGADINLYLVMDNEIVKFATSEVAQETVKNIMAYDLASVAGENNAYTFNFKANSDAETAKIIFYDAETDALVGEVEIPNVKEGENTVSLSANEIPGSDNQKMHWAIQLTGKRIPNIARVNLKDASTTYTCAFVAINNNPESDHFGTIYVGDRVSRSNAKNGLYECDVNAVRKNTEPYTGNHAWNSNYRIGIDGNGKIYMSEWGDANSGVFVADPDSLSGAFSPFFIGDRDANGLITNNGVKVGSSTPCVHVTGTGASTKMYVYLEDFGNGVGVYNIGNEDGTIATSWDKAPSAYLQAPGQLNTNGNVVAGPDGGCWVAQTRSSGNNTQGVPSLVYMAADGTCTFNSGHQDWVTNLSGSMGSGFTVSPDGKTLIINDGDGLLQFFNLTWDGSTPTLTPKYSFRADAQDAKRNIYEMQFDYAGNLVCAGGNVGIYSIPKEEGNVCETPAKTTGGEDGEGFIIVKKAIEPEVVAVTGLVVDKADNMPLEGVTVTFTASVASGTAQQAPAGTVTIETDANGEYTAELTLNVTYNVTYSKVGYNTQTTTFLASKNAQLATVYLEKESPTGMSDANAGKVVKSVKYVNAAGITSDTPFKGMNVVITEYTDGTRSSKKVMK